MASISATLHFAKPRDYDVIDLGHEIRNIEQGKARNKSISSNFYILKSDRTLRVLE